MPLLVRETSLWVCEHAQHVKVDVSGTRMLDQTVEQPISLDSDLTDAVLQLCKVPLRTLQTALLASGAMQRGLTQVSFHTVQ